MIRQKNKMCFLGKTGRESKSRGWKPYTQVVLPEQVEPDIVLQYRKDG
jgi:hypothetical protein